MSRIYVNRIKELSTTTGTGSMTLSGAITGFQTFYSRMVDADTCRYLIEAVDGSGVPTGAWEIGIGTLSSTGTILSRDSVEDSSNAGSPVTFAAGTKHISLIMSASDLEPTTYFHQVVSTSTYTAVYGDDKCWLRMTYAAGNKTFTIPPQSSVPFAYGVQMILWNDAAAGDIVITPGAGVTINGASMYIPPMSGAIIQRKLDDDWDVIRLIEPGQWGALVKKSVDQTAADYTVATAVAWDAEVYDTHNIHSNVTNNTRLTTPTGAKRVRLKAQIELANNAANNWVELRIKKNGAAFDGMAGQTEEIGATTPIVSCITADVNVTGGTDYFEAFLHTQDNSVDVVAAGSWFAMEVIA